MDPQEGSRYLLVLENALFKNPRGCSLMVGFACDVVICRRVRRREPFTNVLLYLIPCDEDSISTTEAIVMGDYVHLTSSTSSAICCIATLAFLASRRAKV